MNHQNTNGELVETGLNALRKHKISVFEKDLEESIEQARPSLHFKGTAREFRKRAKEFGHSTYGEHGGLAKYLNNNPYIDTVIDFITQYMVENPDDVENFISTAEDGLGTSFHKLGLADEEGNIEQTWNKVAVRTKQHGLFGGEGGLAYILDTSMDNIDGLAEIFEEWTEYESVKSKEDGGKASGIAAMLGAKEASNQSDLVANVAEALNITLEGVQKAYQQGGFFKEQGLMDYIVGQVVRSGAQSASMLLFPEGLVEGDSFKYSGKNITQAYDENGLVGQGSLVDLAVGVIIDKYPESLEELQKYMLIYANNSKAQRIAEKMTEISDNPFFNDKASNEKMIKEQIKKGIEKKQGRSVAKAYMRNFTEQFKSVYNEHGAFGKDGALGYLASHLDDFIPIGIFDAELDKQKISGQKVLLENIAEAESLRDIFPIKKSKSWKENYAVSVIEESKRQDVAPDVFLSDDAYRSLRKKLLVDAYGSIDRALPPVDDDNMMQIADYIRKGFDRIHSEGMDSKAFNEMILGMRPDNKFLGKAFDTFAAGHIKKTTMAKIEDYLTLLDKFLEVRHTNENARRDVYRTI